MVQNRRCLPLVLLMLAAPPAWPQGAATTKATECSKIGICYCVNQAVKPEIAAHLDRFRHTIAEQRKAGKTVGYMSLPLTSTGGGNFNVNREVAESIKAAVEKRFGAEYLYLWNPAVLEADLPKGSTGAEYMLMWTSFMEGTDGLGDFDFVYFAGPQDFARYFGFDGDNDMAKLDGYFDRRVKSDPDFAKAVQSGGLSKEAFRRYYAMRASAAVSRGAHDEWNVFRLINERRRADGKLGTGAQIPIMFDGRPVAPSDMEVSVSEGYVGKCAP